MYCGSGKGDSVDRTVEIDADSFESMQARAAELGWGDGLPLVPPTAARVEQMLGGRDPLATLGVMAPRHAEVTNLAVATNAVMAGCPPSVFPVVTTAIRALCRREFNLEGVQTTTHPVAPLVIVHGAAVERLGFNAGSGTFGPGTVANATVGRAVRLCLLHIGGARPGEGDQSTQGQPSKYAYCIAENLPATPWEPYPASVGVLAESAVTVAGHENPHNVENHTSGHAPSLLATIASVFTTLGSNNAWVHDGEVFIVMCPEHAASVAGDGWTRRDVQDFLFNHAQLRLGQLRYRAYPDYSPDQLRARLTMWPRWMRDLDDDDRLVPLVTDPLKFRIVVAGGAGKHSAVIPSWGQTVSVTLPLDD
jgi:hypothetical protein